MIEICSFSVRFSDNIMLMDVLNLRETVNQFFGKIVLVKFHCKINTEIQFYPQPEKIPNEK